MAVVQNTEDTFNFIDIFKKSKLKRKIFRLTVIFFRIRTADIKRTIVEHWRRITMFQTSPMFVSKPTNTLNRIRTESNRQKSHWGKPKKAAEGRGAFVRTGFFSRDRSYGNTKHFSATTSFRCIDHRAATNRGQTCAKGQQRCRERFWCFVEKIN